jgi:hypothetical protein
VEHEFERLGPDGTPRRTGSGRQRRTTDAHPRGSGRGPRCHHRAA